MADPSTATPSSAAAAAAAPGSAPLGRLHRMSTTAGITSQEYVAINLPAVVATLLGLASLAVLVFHQAVLLVIPAAAIAFGVAALVQIRNSNGTQAGRLWAWLGIVLALVLGGTELGSRVVQARSQQSDEQQAAQLFRTLGEHVGRNDYGAAYALFSERFRGRVTREKFDLQWKLVQDSLSPVKSIEWNRVPMMFQRDGAGTPIGTAMAVFQFTRGGEPGRQPVLLRKGTAGWEIEDIPALFPEERKRQGGGGATP